MRKPMTQQQKDVLRARDLERRARVDDFVAMILNLVRAERGIIIDEVKARLCKNGNDLWMTSGAIDLLTGYNIAGREVGAGVVEIQKGKGDARHLVLREALPEYYVRSPHWMIDWLHR